MISRKRAFLAVVVTAIITETLCRIGTNEILKNVHAIYKDGADEAFGKGFDSGWESALDNRYAVSRAFMRNAKVMELN